MEYGRCKENGRPRRLDVENGRLARWY